MKVIIFTCLALVLTGFQRTPSTDRISHLLPHKDTAPTALLGYFQDDYAVRYHISDTLWTQYPKAKYHIIRWNTSLQYLIARNDEHNPGDKGLYTRIDYMFFKDMKEYKWGFCLTAFHEESDSAAEAVAHADRENPKKGCNGFPFSRMRRAEKQDAIER